MDSEKKISAALVETLKRSDFGGLSKDYAEATIDHFLSEGALKDIPVVGTILAIGRLGLSINDQIFSKKLFRFLRCISDLTKEERASMVDRLDNENGFRHQVGERLVELLDRVDSYLKPEMLAKVFRAFATGLIDISMLHRLNTAIDRLPHYEIKAVRAFYDLKHPDHNKISESTFAILATAGLAVPASAFGGMAYSPNEVCDTFVSLGLDL